LFCLVESIGGKAVVNNQLPRYPFRDSILRICTTFSNGDYYDSEFEHCKDLAWPTAVFFCAHTLSSLRQYADSSVSETKSMQSTIPNCMWTRLMYNLDPGRSRMIVLLCSPRYRQEKYARNIGLCFHT
jgi:hypothetical protein